MKPQSRAICGFQHRAKPGGCVSVNTGTAPRPLLTSCLLLRSAQSGQLRHTLRGHDRKWQVAGSGRKKGLATEDANWYRVKPTRSTFPLLHQPHGEDARFRATGPSGSRAPSDIQQMAMSHGAKADVLKAKGSHGPDSLPATDLSSADCLQRPYITSVPPHMGAPGR